MNIKNVLPKLAAILTVIVVLASCEEDFNDIGSNIISDQPSNSQLFISPVNSYSRKLSPLQTTNLPNYQLGVYNDPVYGRTTANILSQLVQNVPGSVFGENPKIDSVYLYIPFLSTETLGVSSEPSTFKLDSVFGSGPIRLNVFESKYFLRDFDPSSGFEEQQKYYSDQKTLFESNLGPRIGSAQVFPSNEPITLKSGEQDEQKLGPGIRIALENNFFKEKILDNEGSAELDNNNNFKDFFRGIYLQSGISGPESFLALLNINQASVSVYYTNEIIIPNDDGDIVQEQQNEYKLTLAGVTVNTLERQLPQHIQDKVTNPNTASGEENLYLRNDIVSIINLFGEDADNNGVADELEELRINNWLVTEANLIFYVDKDKVAGGEIEPERLIIYDLKNNTTLRDYNIDPIIGADALNSLTNHLGRLERGSDGNGDFYKIRITSHISNLISNGAENVPLALTVSQNVLRTGFRDILNNVPPGITQVPVSSVISPEGTVLFGNNTANEAKRLKLQIFYTELK